MMNFCGAEKCMRLQNQKISNGVFLILISFFAILVLATPIFVSAQECPEGYVCIDNPLKQGDIPGIISAVTGLLRNIAIPLGIVILVWGGIQIMTAGGSEEKVTQGKKTIMWAVIGVAIVILVDFIVGFVKEILGAK